MRELSWAVRTDGALTVVDVAGDVDLAVGGQLWTVLEPLLAPGANVVLDCSAVTFFDSTGLRVTLQAAKQAGRVGAAFGLAALPHAVAQVLELADVGHLFSIYTDPTDAQLAA